MTEEGRTLPPSEGRIGAAARAGLFPRSRLLTVGFTLVAGAAVLWLLGGWMAGHFTRMAGVGLGDALAARTDPEGYLFEALWIGVSILAPLAAVILIAAVLPSVIGALVQRRGGGQTTVPLPRLVGEGRGSGLVAIMAVVVFTLISVEIARDHGLLMVEAGDPGAAGEAILSIVVSLFASAGAVSLLGGGLQLVLERTRIWRALHVSASEATRDLRDAAGDKEARSRMAAMGRGGVER